MNNNKKPSICSETISNSRNTPAREKVSEPTAKDFKTDQVKFLIYSQN